MKEELSYWVTIDGENIEITPPNLDICREHYTRLQRYMSNSYDEQCLNIGAKVVCPSLNLGGNQ